jgi:hypothetical protein
MQDCEISLGLRQEKRFSDFKLKPRNWRSDGQTRSHLCLGSVFFARGRLPGGDGPIPSLPAAWVSKLDFVRSANGHFRRKTAVRQDNEVS